MACKVLVGQHGDSSQNLYFVCRFVPAHAVRCLQSPSSPIQKRENKGQCFLSPKFQDIKALKPGHLASNLVPQKCLWKNGVNILSENSLRSYIPTAFSEITSVNIEDRKSKRLRVKMEGFIGVDDFFHFVAKCNTDVVNSPMPPYC